MKIMSRVTGVLFVVLAAIAACSTAAMAKDFYSNTELQLHTDPNRKTSDAASKKDIFTVTFDHFSEWTYGDNYFFLDIEGKDDFSSDADTLYFEYAPRLSLDRVLKKEKLLDLDFISETYATVQYNNSDRAFINRVWLSGVSFDLNFQPNFGFSNISFMIRNEATQDASYQITYVWGQPFVIDSLDLNFKGFMDIWENDKETVVLTEPQFRLNLSSFVGQEHILSQAALGTEIEISRNFFEPGGGWVVNPTLFFAVSF